MLPNLVVIGARKSGTTSLHRYLDAHPEIVMSQPKELNFFSNESQWRRGVDWYARQFEDARRIRGDVSPNYTDHPRTSGVPERMAQVIPDAKLVYLIRHPIRRLFADYVHRVDSGREKLTIEQALADVETSHYVQRSRYHLQIEQYLKHFPLSNLLLVSQEDLAERRDETLRRVFRFLEVDESFSCRRFQRVWHRTRDKRRKSPIGRAISRAVQASKLSDYAPDLVWHVERVLTYPFSRPIEPPQRLPPRLKRSLVELFARDLRALNESTGWDVPNFDLNAW